MNASLLVFIAIWLTSASSVSSSKCPNGCTCEKTLSSIKCHIPTARVLPQNTFPDNVTKLDFSGNNILNLSPGCLRSIPNLEEIILDANKIYFLENGAFKGAKKLRVISLEDNNIHYIDDDVFSSLPDLEELNLMKNQITKFPNVVENSKLVVLSLSFNNIEEIPANSLENNKNLKELHLKSNKLTKLPKNIFPEDVSNFTVLNLVRNQLRDIPDIVRQMSKLETLNLCYNPLKIFPQVFLRLNSLKTLSLTDVGLSKIPEFWHSEVLEHLYVGQNNIDGTSLKNFQLPNLKTLNVAENPLGVITENAFESVPSLEQLFASSCEISVIEDKAFENLSSLKKMDLHGNKLTKIPNLRQNTVVEEVNLNGNKLSVLDDDIFSELPNLKKLLLGNNLISDFKPSVFGSEKASVESLDLSGNRLENIKSFVNMKTQNMTTLDLSNNSMSGELSLTTIRGLTSLETLNLQKNGIENISSTIEDTMPSLQRLFICDNNVTDLENVPLSRFPNLTEFTADRNKIQQLLKQTFVNNSLLEKITLVGNDLQNIEEGAFKTLSELSELLLIFNNLSKVPDLTANHKLIKFGICFNPVGNLPVGALKGPKALEFVLLRSVGLSSLESNVFGNTKNIKYLNLANGNSLTKVPSVIRNMTSLRLLKLTGNPIVHLTVRDFAGLNNIRNIRLDNMRLKTIDLTEFFPALPAIRSLYLAGNPWECDCQMEWYALGVDGARARVTTEDRDQLTCAGPGRLNGKSFDYLRLGDFAHCKESEVLMVYETSALISLPSISKIAPHAEAFHRISYMSLPRGLESVLLLEKHKRELQLRTLIPNTSYLVCVSTVIKSSHVTDKVKDFSANWTNDGVLYKVLSNRNQNFASESCKKFTTLPPSIHTPWSKIGISEVNQRPQYLFIVYTVLGCAVGVALIVLVSFLVVWCRRKKAKLADNISTPDGFSNISDTNANTTQKKHVKLEEKGKQHNTSEVEGNGEVVEMTTESGYENQACEDNSAQRTKL